MIRTNGDRYCRNPYFLNSICTSKAGLLPYSKSPYGDTNSQGIVASSKGGNQRDLQTLSELNQRNKGSTKLLGAKASDANMIMNEI